jgi:maltose O-acetyltransferase
MTDLELMNAGELHYFDDEEINRLSHRAKELIERYNAAAANDDSTRTAILKELLGKIEGRCAIMPPFHCDYGKFIEIGDGTFLNYDCIILDACKVKIGKHVLIGPRTCIYSATHPIYAPVRTAGYDTCKPVTICDNVWLGGNVVVNPGVTIGEGSVVGSGSVVTKDIPANVIAAGNPCRVIREITEDDKIYWESQREEYLKLRKNNDK